MYIKMMLFIILVLALFNCSGKGNIEDGGINRDDIMDTFKDENSKDTINDFSQDFSVDPGVDIDIGVDSSSDTREIEDSYEDLVEVDDLPPPCEPPVVVNNLVITEEPNDILIIGSTGYIVTSRGTSSGSLIVLDINDPSRPSIHYTEQLSGVGEDLELYQTEYLIVATGNSGIGLWNITSPFSPGLISSLDTSYAKGAFVYNNISYIFDGYQGVKLVDIENPFAPALISQYDTGDFAKDGVIYNDGSRVYLYVADEHGGVEIVDVTVETNPQHLNTISIPQGDQDIQAVTIDIVFPWLFVSLLKGGLNIYDITDPANPTLITNIHPGFGFVYHSILISTYLFVASGFQGLVIYDIRDIRSPHLLYTLDTLGNTKRVLFSGNYLYLLDGDDINRSGNQAALRTVDLRCYTP